MLLGAKRLSALQVCVVVDGDGRARRPRASSWDVFLVALFGLAIYGGYVAWQSCAACDLSGHASARR
jgi:hypothetical protein